jgi:hypothetical protein
MVAMLASFVLSPLQRTIPSAASAPMAASYTYGPECVMVAESTAFSVSRA